MSNDPAINAALMNMCAQAQASPASGSSGAPPAAVTTEGSSGTDGAARAPFVPPDRQPQDYQWLREAMASVESPERQVKRLLNTMEKDGVEDEAYAAGLEELSDLVEDINWATEFTLMNGPARVLKVLEEGKPASSTTSEARAALAMIIAHASQLNEQVQKAFADHHWEKTLLPMAEKETNPLVLAALLHACSCLCRDSPANTVVFLQNGGMDALAALLRRTPENSTGRVTDKIVARCMFFVSYLAAEGVSTEEVIRLICEHAEDNDAEMVQCAAAKALCELAVKSPSLVKNVVRACMPNRLKEWKSMQHEDEPQDARLQFVNRLDQVS